jgi:hypothetical protein
MNMTDNELIAEFMGIKVRQTAVCLYPCDEDGMIDYKNAEPYWPHLDWNDLMPVVEKIMKMDTLFEINKDRSHKDGIPTILLWTVDSVNHGLKGNDLKDSIYKSVLSFIRWYNSVERKETK